MSDGKLACLAWLTILTGHEAFSDNGTEDNTWQITSIEPRPTASSHEKTNYSAGSTFTAGDTIAILEDKIVSEDQENVSVTQTYAIETDLKLHYTATGNGYKNTGNIIEREHADAYIPIRDTHVGDSYAHTILVEIHGTTPKQYINFMGADVPVLDKYLCQSPPLPSTSERHCQCDKECVIYRDCCVDVFENIFETGNQSVIETNLRSANLWYMQTQKPTIQMKYMTLITDYGQCVGVFINKQKVTKGYSMISGCPTESTEYVRTSCEHSNGKLQSIPVSLKIMGPWQVVFRNVFCAICHGVEKDDVSLWRTTAACPSDIHLNDTEMINSTRFEICALSFDEPGETLGKLRNCISRTDLPQCENTILTKDSINAEDEFVCQQYIAPVKVMELVFRNIHCARCSQGTIFLVHHKQPSFPTFETVEITAKPQAAPGLFPTVHPPTILSVGFSYLNGFSFFSQGGHVHHLARRKCKEGFIYDFISNKCRQIICPFDKVLVGNRCKHDESVYISNNPELLPSYRNELDEYLQVNFTINKLIPTVKNSVIAEIIDNILHGVFETDDNNITFSNTMNNVASVDESPGFVYYFRIRHLTEVLQGLKSVNKLIGNGNFLTFEITSVNLTNIFPHVGSLYCPGGGIAIFAYRNLDVEVDSDMVYVMKQTNRPISMNITKFSLSLDTNSSEFGASIVIECGFLQCPMVPLAADEYEVSNGTVVLNSTGEVVLPGSFEMRQDAMYVCLKVIKKRGIHIEFLYNHYACIIQYVTSSLSILALVLTIVIYFKSASVQTIHGKTLVSLSVSLIIAQAMTLLQNHTGNILCKIVAVVLHLSLLSSFAWMSIISYDMMRTFFVKRPVSGTNKDHIRRYILYSIIGFGIPGLMIVVSIILDRTDTPMKTGYGSAGFCFIANPRTLTAFFSVPMTVCLIFNVFAFIITVYSISSKRRNPHSEKNNKFKFCIIYFKLAVVMGMTWVFAGLASITELVWLWYLSLVLDGLQGVFVFLSFALRARIWREIRLRHRSRNSYQPSLSNDTEISTIVQNRKKCVET